MSLKTYNRKRKFDQTPEPVGKKGKRDRGPLRFVVQLHRASRLHYDFRLEFDGVFKSWAVPKGPSLNPLDQRLAVFVEDHPLEYGSFEGTIPKGNYGAGTVMVWDEGTYVERNSQAREQSEANIKKNFEKGHITFILDGQKLKGEFALIKLKKGDADNAWLLVKKRDAYSTYKRTHGFEDRSVKTGRSLDEIARESKDVWIPKRSAVGAPSPARQSPSERRSAMQQPMPRKTKPMMPVVSRSGAAIDGWIFERDVDGLRAIAEVEKRQIHLYSKSNISFVAKFPDVVNELRTLNTSMVLDGKINSARGKNTYYVSDILYFDGQDLRHLSFKQRLKILGQAFSDTTHIKHVEYIKTPRAGDTIIAKKADSNYQPGISQDWLKISYEADHKRKNARARTQTNPPRTNSTPALTNLDKIFWPKEQITKGDLINYYKSIAELILPYLTDRPQSLNRQPNGIAAPGFYQKDLTGHHPRWLKTERIFSESANKSIDYVLCQDERSLLYLVNLGCIEINPWFSRVGQLDRPDFLVIDLDPDDNPFSQVVEIALQVHHLLSASGATSFCKTSGATGIHICVPTGGRYDYGQVRQFAESVCQLIARKLPAITSVERNPNRRRRKIYLDFMQNRRGQTLAAPYCVRPKPGAPVSMPLRWKELTPDLRPENFNIQNALKRVQKVGDLWRPVLEDPIDLDACVSKLRRKFRSPL